MSSWLVNHAAENVWCRPSEDGRFIIKPARLCNKRGDVFGVQVSEHHIQLPDITNWYHTYQIGLQDPEALNFGTWGGWKSAKDIVNENGVVIIPYIESGRQIPLDLVYFRFISNHNLLMAVKRYETQVNVSNEEVFIKIYTGKYQTHPDWTSEHKIFCESHVVRTPEDITGLIIRHGQASRKPGMVLCTVNGYPVDKFSVNNVKAWDYVEYIHDGTMREVHKFYLDELPSFHSTLDKFGKLLVHLPKAIDTVLHLNDIELYLFKNGVGRFVHTHMMADLRQLTHRDFSISSKHLYDYGICNPEWWEGYGDVELVMYVRQPALDNMVEFDSNRILELYQMDDDQIISAIVGPDDSLDIWKASTLEQAPYARLINAMPEHITRKLVTDAYGYNACSKLLGYNYTPVIYDTEGNPRAPVHFGMVQQCSIFEYDRKGLLLGWSNHSVFEGSMHICKYKDTAFVEIIEGIGTDELDIEFGTTMTKVNPMYQYRYYLDETVSEKPTWKYTEVTDSNAYDILADGTVVWHTDPTRFLPVRQSDRSFLVNEFKFENADMLSGKGLLYFNAQYKNKLTATYTPLEFEPETVEVWLNGRSLVIGVSAIVDWPMVGICDKTIVEEIGNKDFNIVLRARNFVPRSTKYTMPKHGFVYDGILSNNSRYDIKDDKVIRVIAGGRMFDRSQVTFREDLGRVAGKLPNGMPYQITDPLIPLRNHIEYPTYPFHAIAKETDAAVEEYLTQAIPQPPAVDINPITNRYMLFSLTLNKMILDILNGEFAISERPNNYISTEEIEQLMGNYKKFLKADAAFMENIDNDYVVFYPIAVRGMVELYPLEFSFIERVNSLYFNNRVLLNKHLRVKDRP